MKVLTGCDGLLGVSPPVVPGPVSVWLSDVSRKGYFGVNLDGGMLRVLKVLRA